MSLRVALGLSLALVAGCGASPGIDATNDAMSEGSAFLRDPGFELAPFDSGNRAGECLVQAPWGNRSWGIEASTFSDPKDHGLDAARFVASGHQAYFYGKETSGRWGFVRYLQGNLWGGTNCGATPWNTPEPLATYGRDITISLDVYRDRAELLSWTGSWVMLAVNVWFSAPELPEAGGDANGRKPIVMDLIFHHECNWPGCGYRNYVDAAAYHYQAFIDEAPERSWKTMSIPLQKHLQAAFQAFHIPEAAQRNLKLHQLEFLVELHHGEGAATFDNFRLDVR